MFTAFAGFPGEPNHEYLYVNIVMGGKPALLYSKKVNTTKVECRPKQNVYPVLMG